MKIVSLLPSATEIVFALGLGDELEGVTDECDFPEEATKKPVVSRSMLPNRPMSPAETGEMVAERMATKQPLYELDEAAINRIQPDVILTQDLCRVCAVPAGHVEEALAKLGCSSEVVSLDPHSLDEILESIEQAGNVLSREEAAAAITAPMRERIGAVKKEAIRLPGIRTLALEWPEPPWIGGHWIPQMVEIAGGTNLLNERSKPSRRATWKEISDATPEVIAFMPCGYYLEEAESEAANLYANADFADTPAAREGSVFALDATSYFSRPGPRIADGLEILAWVIHPEAFEEPSAEAVTRVERG